MEVNPACPSLTRAKTNATPGVEEKVPALQFWYLSLGLKKSKWQCRRGAIDCRQGVEVTPLRHSFTHAEMNSAPGVEENKTALQFQRLLLELKKLKR